MNAAEAQPLFFDPGEQSHADQVARPCNSAPIVAAVDGSPASGGAVRTAVRLSRELLAPLVLVHVRRAPSGVLGAPFYQRRLSAKQADAQRVLSAALKAAAREGVAAEAEILEGSPRRRILEFARDRGARLVVLGSRRLRLGRSVSRQVIRDSERPIVVAPPHDRPRNTLQPLRGS
jgi:nucleotide-binding universal stress UspA family protein